MFDIPPPVNVDVLIVGVSERPAWGSGIMATFVMVLGRHADGDVDPFYLPYFGPSQQLPPLGSRCRLTYEAGDPEHVGGNRLLPFFQGTVVKHFDCDPAVEMEIDALARLGMELSD